MVYAEVSKGIGLVSEFPYDDQEEELKELRKLPKLLKEPKNEVVFATTNHSQLEAGKALLAEDFQLVDGLHYENPNSGNFVHLWMKVIGNPQKFDDESSYFTLHCCGAQGWIGSQDKHAAQKILHVCFLKPAAPLYNRTAFLARETGRFTHNFAAIGGTKCNHFQHKGGEPK